MINISNMPIARYRILKIKELYFNGEFIVEKYIIKKRNIEYIRINKTEARTYYNNGFSIFLIASKINHNSPFVSLNRIKKRYDLITDFNTKVNCFENYNCNEETGKYAKFFIRLREKEKTTYETTKKNRRKK
jgi:hypothetical protein